MMKIDYINAIEDTFDTSLHIDFNEINMLERKLKNLKEEQKPVKRARTILVKRPGSSRDSTHSADKNAFSFQIRDSSVHSSGSEEEEQKLGYKIPLYCPPPKDVLLAFNMFMESFDKYSAPHKYVPQRPQLPGAKTNTHLSTYIHKLYVYEDYLQREIEKHQRMRNVCDHVTLKHTYNEGMSRSLSRRMSVRMYDQSSGFSFPAEKVSTTTV